MIPWHSALSSDPRADWLAAKSEAMSRAAITFHAPDRERQGLQLRIILYIWWVTGSGKTAMECAEICGWR